MDRVFKFSSPPWNFHRLTLIKQCIHAMQDTPDEMRLFTSNYTSSVNQGPPRSPVRLKECVPLSRTPCPLFLCTFHHTLSVRYPATHSPRIHTARTTNQFPRREPAPLRRLKGRAGRLHNDRAGGDLTGMGSGYARVVRGPIIDLTRFCDFCRPFSDGWREPYLG